MYKNNLQKEPRIKETGCFTGKGFFEKIIKLHSFLCLHMLTNIVNIRVNKRNYYIYYLELFELICLFEE